RLLLLVRIELRGPPTAWVIVQPRHLLRLPPLQPLAHPIPIDLVDVGNLFQRVPALTEQHRVRAHARALGGGGFHNRAQLPALFGREGLHKFRRGFHTHYSTAELIPRCLGRRTKVLGFSVAPELAEEYEQLAARQGTSKSELFRQMVATYQAKLEKEEFFRLQRKMAQRAQKQGICTDKEVERIVFEDR